MSKLKDFENEAKEIAKNYTGKGKGSNPSSLKSIQPPPNPAGPKHQRSLTHGAYSFLTSGIIPCNKCLLRNECDEFKEDKSCAIIEAYQVDKIKEIMVLSHIKDQDITLVQMLARELAFQAVVAKYIAKIGLFRPDQIRKNKVLALQPVLNSYWVSVNAATRMCSELGLSPMARARLKIGDKGFDLAKALAEVREDDK